jgi:DNA-binding CsgD family transcriptional regulator
MNKPSAVIRRDIIASTGPSIFGIQRLDRVSSPKGEKFIFLGVCDGIVNLEREDKAIQPPFLEIDSELFSKWNKI